MGVKVREKDPGSGDWWIFINHNGRRKSKRIGRNKQLAKEVAKTIEARLVLGDTGFDDEKPQVPLFKEIAQLWLEGYVRPLRRHSTYRRYSEVLASHVPASFKAKPIDKIKRSDVRKVLLRIHAQGLSASSVRLTKDVISGVLNHAIDDEVIQVNQAAGVLKRMSLDDPNRSGYVNALTFEETALFLVTCQKYFKPYFAFFLTAFRTGMRLGELLALKWADIDMNSRFIEVKRSYKLKRVSKTKTGKERRVDMSDQLAETLTQLYRQHRKITLQNAKRDDLRSWVFPRNRKPMEQNFIRRVFKRVLEKAGLREVRFHDIRHTFASQLLSRGVTPVYVKEQLGHSSIKMTVDIYGHLIPSSNRDMVNQLDDAHLNAPYAHPEKKHAEQVTDIAPHIIDLVPKGRLELPRMCIH